MLGFQPTIKPSCVAKIKIAGADACPLLTINSLLWRALNRSRRGRYLDNQRVLGSREELAETVVQRRKARTIVADPERTCSELYETPSIDQVWASICRDAWLIRREVGAHILR